MKFGIMFANVGPFSQPEHLSHLATSAESVGVESLWTVEHVVVPSGYASTYPYDESGKMGAGQEDFDITDPLVWLSYVAAATESIRLATGILILPQRQTVLLAKRAAEVDLHPAEFLHCPRRIPDFGHSLDLVVLVHGQ